MIEAVIGVNKAPFKTGLEELKAYAGEFKAELSGMFVGTFAAAGVIEGVKGVFEEYAHIQDLANRFDVSSESIQKFGHAAELSGSSTESFARAMKALEVSISKVQEGAPGSELLVEDFHRLGITVQDLRDLSPDQIMEKIGHSSMQAADMVALLGRNGLELRPMLKDLADGSLQLGDAVDELTTKKIKAADDALTRWGQKIKVVTVGAIASFIDTVKGQVVGFSGAVGLSALDKPQAAPKKDPAAAAAASAGAAWDEIKSDETALNQKLADMDAAAAEKRLAIEQQIADVKKAGAALLQQFEAETDPEKRADIEKEILQNHKQAIEMQQNADEQKKRDDEDDAADQARYDEEMAKLDERLAKAKEDNLSPLEKQKALLEELNEISVRAHSGITPDRQLKEDAIRREEALKELRDLAERNLREIATPNFDSLRQIGGGYKGVNYDYRNAGADQQIALLTEISKNTSEALNKKVKLTIPQASFGGGGTPGGSGSP